MKKSILTFLFAIVGTMAALAQQTPNNTVEMADKFRADGKIYVVVAVACIILAGMTAYMVSLDRKISKLEKELQS